MSPNSTIFQMLKAQVLEEKQRRANCIAIIKEIHAAELHIEVNPLPKRQVSIGSVRKCSPSGKFIGWYHEDQKAGLPNQLMPLEQSTKKQYQQWRKSVITCFQKSIIASILGELSGVARKARGLYQDIMNMHQELASNGIPKHHRAKLIAKTLNCSVEYVRRTLRQINNTKVIAIKNTT